MTLQIALFVQQETHVSKQLEELDNQNLSVDKATIALQEPPILTLSNVLLVPILTLLTEKQAQEA